MCWTPARHQEESRTCIPTPACYGEPHCFHSMCVGANFIQEVRDTSPFCRSFTKGEHQKTGESRHVGMGIPRLIPFPYLKHSTSLTFHSALSEWPFAIPLIFSTAYRCTELHM